MAGRDLKLQFLADRNFSVFTQVKTPQLGRVNQAFQENAFALKSLGMFPFFVLHVCCTRERVAAGAMMQVLGTLESVPNDHPKSEAVAQAFNVLFDKVLEEQARDGEKVALQGMAEALAHLKFVTQEADASIATDGLKSWLSAQVINAWTIFETLCGDLWEAAVNTHPSGLADLKGKGESQSQRNVPLWMLQNHGYNLSGVMGTALKGQLHFDRLETIQDNYERAFFEGREDIDKILRSDGICSLSALRNLLVHRGGVVDQRYLDRIKKLKSAPTGSVGARIDLDGEIVSRMTTDAIDSGCLLVSEVDNWLETHK